MVGHWTDRLNIDTEISSQIESKYGICVSVGRVMKLEEASVTMDGRWIGACYIVWGYRHIKCQSNQSPAHRNVPCAASHHQRISFHGLLEIQINFLSN